MKIDLLLILIGFVRFSIRIIWKRAGIGAEGYGCCSLIGDRRSLFGCPPLSTEGKFVLRVVVYSNRIWLRMGWKWVGIDGKGYANTTYISEFHPHIPAGRIFQKKGLSGGGGRLGRRRPAALFFEKSGRLGCGDGIRRCRLCSHILCHQFQPIFSPFSLKINQILLESTPNLNFPSACYPPNDINEQDPYVLPICVAPVSSRVCCENRRVLSSNTCNFLVEKN